MSISTATAPQESDIPVRLGRYEIVERIAAGGMGEVFLARMAGPGGFMKPVALKRIHPQLAHDTEFIEMLYDEANVASSLQHPNIVRTVDVGSEGDNHYVVLDYVSGEPVGRLHRELKKTGTPIPPWIVAWVGAQIASALHSAHDARSLDGQQLEIIHRDVSPSNIMLSDEGHAMLFDFGVAKAKRRLHQTNHGELKGKLPYMAPETFAGAPADRTVDIFGLGVVLYEMLTDISPFKRDTDVECISALLGLPVPPPHAQRPYIDPNLSAIVMCAMDRNRASRYPTCARLEQALRAWAITTGAPHDASAVANWLEQNFADRIHARRDLLRRVADPSPRALIRQPAAGAGANGDAASGLHSASGLRSASGLMLPGGGGSAPGTAPGVARSASYTPWEGVDPEASFRAAKSRRTGWMVAGGAAVLVTAMGASFVMLLGRGSEASAGASSSSAQATASAVPPPPSSAEGPDPSSTAASAATASSLPSSVAVNKRGNSAPAPTTTRTTAATATATKKGPLARDY